MSTEKLKKECQDYYKKAAKDYDAKRFHSLSSILIDNVYKQTVYNYLKDSNVILDIGTGTGRFAIYFAKMGKKVIAVDSSVEMLDEAKKNAENDGVLSMIDFIEGDIEEIPLNDSSVDGISCIHVLVHYPDVSNAIKEFKRVLKPNGNLVFEIYNRFIASYYNCIWSFFTGIKYFSYKDYYHDYNDIRNILTDNSIMINDSRKVKKVPKFVLKVTLDIINKKWLYNLLMKYESFNFGWVRIIKGVKY